MLSGIIVKVLSIALLIAVGVVLILGIGTLFKGGETSKKYSNKLMQMRVCLLYTSDAADDLLCVDLGGRRIIK